jgi:hypothetical protein
MPSMPQQLLLNTQGKVDGQVFFHIYYYLNLQLTDLVFQWFILLLLFSIHNVRSNTLYLD